MRDPHELVEHFFRQEYGRLVGILARHWGTRHLDRLEDVVQSAMERALQSWAQNGIPENPSAWLLQTSRRIAIDWFRRDQLGKQHLEQLASHANGHFTVEPGTLDEWGDETLRLLFLCCHPRIPAESHVAFALKTVCGLSIQEITRGLLLSSSNIQKRIERARQRLREESLELESLRHPWMQARLDSVRTVLYLIFTEGHSSTASVSGVRQELCWEAIRLAKLLAAHPIGKTPETSALLALFCFHAARLNVRTDIQGSMVLLADQTREQWNWTLVKEGMGWLAGSAVGDSLTRYHLEAAIAWEHCRADEMETTDWAKISQLYEKLSTFVSGPAQTLNWAIAESYLHGPQAGISRLDRFPSESLPKPYPLWFAIRGQLQLSAGNLRCAHEDLTRALREQPTPSDKELILKKLAEVQAVADKNDE